MNIGIIGCGSIGNKRAFAIKSLERELDLNLYVGADIDNSRLLEFKKNFRCETTTEWKKVITNSFVDVVFVCVINKFLFEIVAEAIKFNKHILVEKPAAVNSSQIRKLLDLQRNSNSLIKVGFNHRFYPLILEAKKLIDQKEIGEPMWVRCIYGHRSRPNYNTEWRSSKDLAGGGELLDQGVHVIDLSRWFLGEFVEIYGQIMNSYWNMEVEDNGFLILKTKDNKIANIHTSATEWTNKFLFEIYGTRGALIINGLHKNYGIQKLQIIKLIEDSKREKYFRFSQEERVGSDEDESWTNEIREFVNCIRHNGFVLGDLNDALKAILVVEKVYKIQLKNNGGYENGNIC